MSGDTQGRSPGILGAPPPAVGSPALPTPWGTMKTGPQAYDHLPWPHNFCPTYGTPGVLLLSFNSLYTFI